MRISGCPPSHFLNHYYYLFSYVCSVGKHLQEQQKKIRACLPTHKRGGKWPMQMRTLRVKAMTVPYRNIPEGRGGGGGIPPPKKKVFFLPHNTYQQGGAGGGSFTFLITPATFKLGQGH